MPGAFGASVIYYATITKTTVDPESGEEVEDRFPLLKQYTIFNAQQVNLTANLRHLIDTEAETTTEFVDFAPAEAAVAATQANIRYGGNRCYYCRDTDHIQMVPKERFESERDYYAVLLHELAGHWTEVRCGWTGSCAAGELRAELAAAFACAELNIPNSDDLTNHKAYLQSWLKAMQDDPKFLFAASSAAAKGVSYVMDLSRKPAPDLEAIPF